MHGLVTRLLVERNVLMVMLLKQIAVTTALRGALEDCVSANEKLHADLVRVAEELMGGDVGRMC